MRVLEIEWMTRNCTTLLPPISHHRFRREKWDCNQATRCFFPQSEVGAARACGWPYFAWLQSSSTAKMVLWPMHKFSPLSRTDSSSRRFINYWRCPSILQCRFRRSCLWIILPKSWFGRQPDIRWKTRRCDIATLKIAKMGLYLQATRFF